MAAQIQPTHSYPRPIVHTIAKSCIRVLPTLLVVAGIVGGAWISTVMQLEFLRPMFIGLGLIYAALAFK